MTEQQTFNAADHKQVAERAKKAKQNRKQELEDLRAVLELPAGQRFIWRLLGANFRTSYDPNASRAAFNEGVRNVSLQLWAEVVDARPDLIPQMMRDASP